MKPIYKALVALISVIVILSSAAYGSRLNNSKNNKESPGESKNQGVSTRNKKGLFEWRKRVGDEVANYVARTSAARGTAVHHMCEDYLNNNFDDDKHKKDFLAYCLFGQLKTQALWSIA